MIASVAAVRPGVSLRLAGEGPGEAVVHGGGEVFRLPLTGPALARQAVLVVALPALFPLLPVAVPRPRRVGVLADGFTPFTAERRLPGVAVQTLTGIAAQQWEGVLAALAGVPAGLLREWGVEAVPRPSVVLVDPRRGVVTGLVDWRLD